MAIQQARMRANGRLADFVESLSMVIVGGALMGLVLVVAALVFSWATAAVAQASSSESADHLLLDSSAAVLISLAREVE